MPAGVGPQLFRGTKPIFVGCPLGTASVLLEFVGEDSDLVVSECSDPMSGRSCRLTLMKRRGVLELPPRMLVRRRMILLPVALRGDIVSMGSALV